MPKVSAFTPFASKTVIPSATLNTKLDALRDGVNNIDETQILTTSEIAIKNTAQTISGVWTFSANPVFNANAISDSALSTNVALLGSTQSFTGVKSFTERIGLARLPLYGATPTTAAYDGAMYINSSDGKAYIYYHGVGASRLDYTGVYTGGAPNVYSGAGVVDENSPLQLMFLCDSGFTSVNINLIGKDFPSYIYTELPQHLHAFGTLALASGTVVNLDHTHDTVLDHTHSGSFPSYAHQHKFPHEHDMGTLKATTPSHEHGGWTGDYSYSYYSAPTHKHSIPTQAAMVCTWSGTMDDVASAKTAATTDAPVSVGGFSKTKTSEAGSTTYSSTPSVNTTMSGSTANAGISGGTLNDTKKTNVTSAIKIYITNDMSAGWGTGYDSATYPALANINNANGTGDIDITSKCSVGFNYIKIVDETLKTGGTIMWHIKSV